MNSTAVCSYVWTSALPEWLDFVRQSGWHPMLVALAQGLAALACGVLARDEHVAAAGSVAWTIGAAVLALLALNSLFALDVLAIQLLRSLACEQGWYQVRREIQVATLLLLSAAVVLASGAWRRLQCDQHRSLRWLVSGLAVLLTMALLRAISLHFTDVIINARVAGWSVGRLVDGLGLGLIAMGLTVAFRGPRA